MNNPKQIIRNNLLKLLRRSSAYINYARVPDMEVSLRDISNDYQLLFVKKESDGPWLPPVTTDKEIHRKFLDAMSGITQDRFVLLGQNWRIWGNQGAVITNKGALLGDVSKEFDNKDHSIFKQFKLIRPKKLDCTVAILDASGSNVYYHWMFDILPRIGLLRQSGSLNLVDKFVISYSGEPYQQETLFRLDIDPQSLIIPSGHWDFHIQVSKLIVPSLGSKLDYPSFEACLFLRKLYKNEINNTVQKKRIYIQRQKGRRILNETELLSFLKPLNFEIVHTENLTVAQQANLFSKSEIVLGPHGAGFTNIVFCKTGTTIVDLFSPSWINPCYWIIASQLNLKYGYMTGEPLADTTMIENKAADILIDIQKLKNLFSKLSICL